MVFRRAGRAIVYYRPVARAREFARGIGAQLVSDADEIRALGRADQIIE